MTVLLIVIIFLFFIAIIPYEKIANHWDKYILQLKENRLKQEKIAMWVISCREHNLHPFESNRWKWFLQHIQNKEIRQ